MVGRALNIAPRDRCAGTRAAPRVTSGTARGRDLWKLPELWTHKPAPTAPWKTTEQVFHSYHRSSFFSGKCITETKALTCPRNRGNLTDRPTLAGCWSTRPSSPSRLSPAGFPERLRAISCWYDNAPERAARFDFRSEESPGHGPWTDDETPLGFIVPSQSHRNETDCPDLEQLTGPVRSWSET